MIVRGICCLNPGIPDETENIRIISIVGRFLEHSRIYIFGRSEREKMYISSADFMTRNTERRVEVAAPVLDKDIHRQIRRMFDLMLKDNCQAWELNSDGMYTRVRNEEEKRDTQDMFYDMAYKNAESSAFSNEKTILRSGSSNLSKSRSIRSGLLSRLFRKKGS